jgi:alpha-galactosidase
MQDALNATGRKIAYAICEWGLDFPSAWAPAMGNTWRVTNDIIPEWRTTSRILNQVVPQTSYAGPGHWLDLDMLEVGNNVFSKAEEETHFSLWGIIKSPLIIGGRLNDTLGSINETSLAILKNKDVINYNQDSLGVAASFRRRWTEEQYELWAGPLSKNRTVVALINWADVDRELTLDLPDAGLQFAGLVRDIWQNKTTQNVRTSYTANVAAHGTMLLELSDTTPAGTYDVSSFGAVEG